MLSARLADNCLAPVVDEVSVRAVVARVRALHGDALHVVLKPCAGHQAIGLGPGQVGAADKRLNFRREGPCRVGAPSRLHVCGVSHERARLRHAKKRAESTLA